ncbi:hypothetical protein O181_067982 [Austropuccinia psidii MF-1]|uniref:Tet-like 2OG-Fe(II) oxygenase domain-containing protein n=1 Tax=Austropuccinia psidii MF-1 TaxID=1389203 RepID=A0A9Q3I5U6_9BASI|nr:hypothetical protein [Austropuccinia psidii MF-1]
MPVSANITASEIWMVVDVNQIKRIHFGRVEIFSSTGLIIARVEFQPFTTMSEGEVNQWDELSQFLFREKRFTDPIATNGALLEGFMFAIGWGKCSSKNEQFGLYGSVGKIENAKDEWQKEGAHLSSVFLTPMRAANTSHANPHPCSGSRQLTRQSLCLCRLLTIHTPILMLVKVPKNAKNCLGLYRLPTIHSPILTLVKVAKNADNFLCLGRLQTIYPLILTLVKVPHNAENFLFLWRIPTIHTPILTPVQAPNNTHANPYACAGS